MIVFLWNIYLSFFCFFFQDCGLVTLQTYSI
uniref:Uncharacterized protein n=1 Tax=Lepeophtheirus salmonis TaxID=72036 RepID=A0A0K2U9B4_LEPSM